MIGNKCLLDTSIIIQAFRKDNEISDKLDRIKEIYVPVIVAGELYFGAFKSNDAKKHLKIIDGFLRNCLLLNTNEVTAKFYGTIKTSLSQKGKPIPENDIWIAATALEYKLPLFTTDSHFKEIDILQIFN